MRCVRNLAALGVALAIVAVEVRGEPAEATLPPAVERAVDFHREVLPILARRCALCHTENRREGGLSLATREQLLAGGDSGASVVVGQSGESLLVRMVAGVEEGRLMPAKGPRLDAEEVGILRRWIDDNLPWEADVTLTPASGLAPLAPRTPEVPASTGTSAHPIDRFLSRYFAAQAVAVGEPVDDRTFARRVYLDLVGLLPTPEQFAAFQQDRRPDKRQRLVRTLLQDKQAYALHWMTFWNDLLRNSYRGTGFIDNGRTQITGWLFGSLYDNKPYDQFVSELITPQPEAAGFLKGIKWRGVVNASQRPEMQAAQSIGQVFLGINLKCASCHDSFVDPWKLSEAYALAAVFSEEPLEIHRCDKPTGEMATPGFLFPQLGTITSAAPADQRQVELAALVSAPENGRLARTVVNRLWERLFGRGIVANVDRMDDEPFDADLLDWLASDLAAHDFDLKHTLEQICTSQAYQLPAQPASANPGAQPFAGPVVRRMSAEQFVDAVCQVRGQWLAETSSMTNVDGRGQGGQLTAVRKELDQRGAKPESLPLRAVLVDADALLVGLGRPNREQIVTRRDSFSTPLEALELTNGEVLDGLLKPGAEALIQPQPKTPRLVVELFRSSLSRDPRAAERQVAVAMVGSPPTAEGVQDLLWTIVMLPEFQLID